MASCAVKPLHFLASLLLLTFVVQKFPPVKGDQALINRICSKTGNNRQYSLNCFRIPGSDKKDIKGLADNAIRCGSSTAFNTRQATLDLAKKSAGTLRENLYKCVGALVDTLTDYAKALSNLHSGHYSDTKNDLNRAKFRVAVCQKLLGMRVLPSERLPSDFVKNYATLMGETEMAMDVVSQIPA